MHMTGARMRLIRIALGYTMAEFIIEVKKAWPKTDRETIQRWENNTWEIPADVADHVDSLWEELKLKADAALAFLDKQIEAGQEPDPVALSLFATPESLEKAHPGMGWGNHTAQVSLLAFLLEADGFKTDINYAPIEK